MTHVEHETNSQIRFKTTMIEQHLSGYSDAYIIVKRI